MTSSIGRSVIYGHDASTTRCTDASIFHHISTRMHHSHGVAVDAAADPGALAAGAAAGATAAAGTPAGVATDAAHWPGPAGASSTPRGTEVANGAATAGALVAPAAGAGAGACTPSLRMRIVFSCLSLAGWGCSVSIISRENPAGLVSTAEGLEGSGRGRSGTE
jgi:hypothetical protein